MNKPVSWRLIAFVFLVGMGLAGNVWWCIRLISTGEAVLITTVVTVVGTCVGIGFLGYILDPLDRLRGLKSEKKDNS